MKGKASLSGIRRLYGLLAISGAGPNAGCRGSGTILPRQLCLVGSSDIDDSPPVPIPDSSNDLPSRSLFSDFPALRSYPLLKPHFIPCSPPSTASLYRLSSETHHFRSSFGFSAVQFATLRGGVEGEQEEVGGLEKQDRDEKIHGEAQGRNACAEDTASTSEAEVDNAKAVRNCHELGSLGKKARKGVGWSELGWTCEEVVNWPNAISTARLLSGPLIAWMILHEQWSTAFVGLVIAGVSDWLDGYVARKMNINSVLGSYLDPIADKILVGSVAVSMAYVGLLHPGLVGLIVARDGVLMGGAFIHRAHSPDWQWKDWREFFRISIGGAGKVEPLFISKVNTVLQLALVGVALLQPALSMEDTYFLVPMLSWSVVATTSMSWVAYAYIYWKKPENLTALRHVAKSLRHDNSQGSPSTHLKS